MRIVIDARFYGIENTGLGRYTLNLVESLKKKDKDNKYIILLRRHYFNRLKFSNNWEKVLFDYGHYSFSEQIALPITLYKLKPDLVHFPHFNVPIFWFGNFIVTLHDLLMHKFKGKETTNLPFFLYPIKRLGYYISFTYAALRAKKIIVPTEYVKKDFLGLYKRSPNDVKVIYEGLDERYLTKVTDKEDALKKFHINGKYFIYTGNAYPHKNLPNAIKALIQLNKKSKEKVLFLISSARSVFTKRIEELIKKLNAGKYVKFLGFISDGDLKTLYKEAIAFVYPSLSEGFGLQGLEVMASGGIVLASNIKVFKEVYEDNVIYFEPRSIESIAKAMEDALNLEDGKRRKLMEKSQLFLKRYSWEKMAEETMKVYKEAVKNFRE